MKRLTEGWFSFKGVKCDAYGLKLLKMPARERAAERGEFATASGRSGDLWQGDGAYEAYDIQCSCETTDAFSADDAHAWLNGAGDLVFSDEQNRSYKARVVAAIPYENKYISFDKKIYTITFHVQPFRYLYPEAAEFDAMSLATITNPGSVYSLPKITIYATGDITLSIGGNMLQLSGLTEGCVIDCEMGEVFDLSEAAFLNSSAEIDEFPRLEPGGNYLSYTGSITAIRILPRWRYA